MKNRVIFNSSEILRSKIKIKLIDGEGTPESDLWDYKREIDFQKPTEGVEISKDIAAFANTWGGTLLLGIQELVDSNNIKSAYNVLNIPDIEKYKHKIFDSIALHLFPKIDVDPCVINVPGKGNILAVNIEPSTDKFICVDGHPSQDHPIYFPFRTSHRNMFHDPQKAQEIIMNMKKRDVYFKLNNLHPRLRTISLSSPFLGTNGRQIYVRREELRISQIHDNEVTLSMLPSQRIVNVPFGLIEDVWETHDEKIGMIVNSAVVFPIEENLGGFISQVNTIGDKVII